MKGIQEITGKRISNNLWKNQFLNLKILKEEVNDGRERAVSHPSSSAGKWLSPLTSSIHGIQEITGKRILEFIILLISDYRSMIGYLLFLELLTFAMFSSFSSRFLMLLFYWNQHVLLCWSSCNVETTKNKNEETES